MEVSPLEGGGRRDAVRRWQENDRPQFPADCASRRFGFVRCALAIQGNTPASDDLTSRASNENGAREGRRSWRYRLRTGLDRISQREGSFGAGAGFCGGAGFGAGGTFMVPLVGRGGCCIVPLVGRGGWCIEVEDVEADTE
jgi:hypothetical protein